MSNQTSTARQLQVRAWTLLGFNYTQRIADAVDYSREYVSRLLNERVPLTEEAQRRITTFLDEEEARVAEQEVSQ